MLLYELLGAVVGDSHQIDRILFYGDNMYTIANVQNIAVHYKQKILYPTA